MSIYRYMKKTLSTIVFILFLSVIVSFSVVHAQEAQNEDTVILPQDAVVDQDYFATGETVTIAGTVNGDVYVAGGNIVVTGTINGDLFAAGGMVTIRGDISDDVRVAGGQILISGTVGKNVTAMGGSVTISDAANIEGSLVSGTGSLSIYGPIAKGATIGAGSMQLDSTIGGNVLAGVGQMVLNPGATVGGNMTYYSEQKAEIQQGAVIEGEVNMKAPPAPKEVTEAQKEQAKEALWKASIISRIFYLISLYVIGAIFLLVVPVFTQKVSAYLKTDPWKSIGMGFLILFMTPFLILVLLMTVVAIPLALMLIAVYLIYIYLSVLFSTYFIGEKFMSYFSKKNSPYLILLVGLITYGLLISIPFVGWIFSFIAMLAGMGALLMKKQEYIKDLRKRKFA